MLRLALSLSMRLCVPFRALAVLVDVGRRQNGSLRVERTGLLLGRWRVVDMTGVHADADTDVALVVNYFAVVVDLGVGGIVDKVLAGNGTELCDSVLVILGIGVQDSTVFARLHFLLLFLDIRVLIYQERLLLWVAYCHYF